MISKELAREKAIYGLRFEFGGNMLSLGKYRESKKYHVYSIIISYPRIPQKESEELTFDDPTLIGEILVHKVTGRVNHTPTEILNKRVKEIKQHGKIQHLK